MKVECYQNHTKILYNYRFLKKVFSCPAKLVTKMILTYSLNMFLGLVFCWKVWSYEYSELQIIGFYQILFAQNRSKSGSKATFCTFILQTVIRKFRKTCPNKSCIYLVPQRKMQGLVAAPSALSTPLHF